MDEESVNIDVPEEAMGVATKLKDNGTKWVFTHAIKCRKP